MPGSSRAVKNFGRDRKLSLCRILHILPFLLNSFRIFGQHCFSCKYISLEFVGFPTNKKIFYHNFLILRVFPTNSLKIVIPDRMLSFFIYRNIQPIIIRMLKKRPFLIPVILIPGTSIYNQLLNPFRVSDIIKAQFSVTG